MGSGRVSRSEKRLKEAHVRKPSFSVKKRLKGRDEVSDRSTQRQSMGAHESTRTVRVRFFAI